MKFANPHLLWLLLLTPLLAAFFWWSLRKRRSLMAAFIPPRLLEGLTVGVSFRSLSWRYATLVLAFIFLVLALARPQWGFYWEEAKLRGLDIVVAIDTSKSMLAEDIAPNRLTRAKLAALDLAAQARTDRVGLVAFAGSGFLQCPLTIDDSAFRQSVEALDVSTIPVGGSALAEAIEAATTAYKEGENHRILVILSDGENHEEGAVEAATKADKAGLKIYCIGVGTTEGARIPIPNGQGHVEYVRDDAASIVVSKLNEGLLRDVASATTGGFYLPLRGARTMETLYQEVLSKLPKSEHQEKLIKQYYERFHWPLAIAIGLLILEFLWPEMRGRKRTQNQAASAPLLKPAPASAALLLGLALLFPQGASLASSAKALRDYQAGNFPRSLSEYERLLEKNPNDPRLQFNAGAAAYQNGKYDAALKRFNEAANSPDLDLQQSAYYNRGNTYFRMGDNAQDPNQRSESWKKAIKDYESALKLGPKDNDATYNRDLVKKLLEELQQQMPQQQNQNNDDKSDDKKDNQQQQQQENQSNQDKNDQQKQDQQQQNQQQQAQQNQQQQQGQQDQQQQQQAQAQQNQQEQKEGADQKQKQQARAQEQDKKEQQEKQAQAGEEKEEGEGAKEDESTPAAPGEMTPREAKRLLDSQKGDEKMFPASGREAAPNRKRPLKDW